MFGGIIRRIGFFTLDAIKGGKVINHYKDIEYKMSDKIRSNELKDILSYTKNNVPYYSNIKEDKLTNFPVIKKTIIMENYNGFQSREFIDKKLHWVSTSGSTGTPFKACQDSNKRNRTVADLLYFHRINGWELGSRYLFLRAWTSSYSISKMKLFLQNFIVADVIKFDDEAKETIRQRLKKDKKIQIILGYASGLDNFVNYLEKKGDKSEMFNIKVIFSASDNLMDSTKIKLEKMFNCPVINRYSNEELGVLACTSEYDNVFRLNTASYHFELLKLDSDEPVRPGELGRLVITDLYNRAMPFIRYDTGDLAISNDENRECLKTLSSLEGRIADVIRDVDGNLISAVMVNNYLHKYYKIKQYQMVQDKKNHYIFKVVCKKDDYGIEDLLKICKQILGGSANVEIDYVDKIPVEQTGKYKTIVNKYVERFSS